MRVELEALVHELKHLRREGHETVYLGDGTLAQLRAAVAKIRGTASPANSSATATFSTAGREEAEVPPANRATAADLAQVWQNTATPSKRPQATAPVPAKPAGGAALPPPPTAPTFKGSREEQWRALREWVLGDVVCQEHVRPGKKVVFGIGTIDAPILFCGEAPGAEEETQGEPFVGPAGQLLTKIIQAMGLSREKVYIANIMNWRPEMPTTFGNRPPTATEMAYCLPYLKAQVALVRPKVIVALGKTAVDGLLGPDSNRRMGSIRGQWTEFEGIPLIPTFHPSYLLRNNTNATKRQVWEDMMAVMERLKMPISAKQRTYFSSPD